MGQLRYSPTARADLAKIASAIVSNNGVTVAELTIARLERSLTNLADFLRMGRKRPQLGRGVWSWPMRPWLAFYRIASEDIEVIRIVYGRRRMTRKLVMGEQDR